MTGLQDFEKLPLDCVQFRTNCTGAACWNTTVETNCTGYYVYVDQDVAFWQIPQLIILIFLFVFIVFGNTCVLVAIGLSETGRKTRMNFFIMNLAIADLSVGIFHVTIDIAEKCLVAWHGGPALCKIIRYFQVFVIYASTFMIVSLSIDRVDAIARPMNFTRKALTVKVLVYAAWITSGLLSIPAFLLFDAVTLNEETHCIIKLQKRWHWQLYITVIALTAFIIPALIIAACYTIITVVIWDKGRGFSNTFQSPSGRNPSSQIRQHPNRGNKGIIPQAKIRTFKMTLIIVCVFVLSWCPYFVFNLIDVFEDPNNKSMTQFAVTSLVQSLAPLNSAANPIIYGAFSTRVCNNLRRIPFVAEICDCLFKCRVNRQSSLHGVNASHTDQTYVDGSANKNRYLANKGRRLTNEQETSNLLGQGQIARNGCHHRSQCAHRTCDTCCTCGKKPKGPNYRRPSGLPLVNRKMTAQDTIILETYRISCENGKSQNSVYRQSSLTGEDSSYAVPNSAATGNTHEMNGLIVDGSGTTLLRKEHGTISEEPSNFAV